MRADLKAVLAASIGALTDGCNVVPDEDDGQTLLVEYPSIYPGGGEVYVSPRVKIEAGARSALDPCITRALTPYIAGELPDWPFRVANVATLAPERTFWEKLLILHGLHCGYRDAGRLPADKDRISRHYYDAAMIASSSTGEAALSDTALLDAVRTHNLVAFRQAWKRFEEAVPGSLRLDPSGGTSRGRQAGLPGHARHDPRRRSGVRMDRRPASPRGSGGEPDVVPPGGMPAHQPSSARAPTARFSPADARLHRETPRMLPEGPLESARPRLRGVGRSGSGFRPLTQRAA